MARQNIQFKGLRHAPSDITGQDGDLLECVNLIHENGELKPIEMPEKTVMRGYGKDENVYILVAVHNLTDGKKFVFARFDGTNTNIIVKRDGQTAVFYEHAIMGEEIQWAETIGNTLIIGTDKSTHYAFYKNGNYKWLGDKLPQPVFEFDLDRDDIYGNGYKLIEKGGTSTLTYKDTSIDGIALKPQFIGTGDMGNSEAISLDNTSDENKKLFRDGIRSHIETLLNRAKMNNVFVFPFFVRYAVRMYDGNHVMHSSPMLMIPSSLICPILAYLGMKDYALHDDEDLHEYTLAIEEVKFRALKLLIKFKGFCDDEGNDIQNLSDWEDIIKGVDLFMSSPIYSYNDRLWDDLNNVPDKFYVFNKTIEINPIQYVEDETSKDYGLYYGQNKKLSWWDILTSTTDSPFDYDATGVFHGQSSDITVYKYRKIPLPSYTGSEMMEKIKNTSLFYRIKQYDFIEIMSEWDEPREFNEDAEYGLLERLETLPILQDDYASRSRMMGKVDYNYNQRLLLGNIKLQAPLWYQDAKRYTNDYAMYVELRFVIEKQEKTICIKQLYMSEGSGSGLGKKDFGHYLFYPDPDCKKVYVMLSGTTTPTFVIPMQEHPTLHGAYALMPDLQSLYEAYEDEVFDDVSYLDFPTPSTDSGRYYQQPNTIAMSSVANPFHFPATNFKDIGRTKVVGIAANTLDVSSGQWGQYPLYVFCSDGIIAVMIDGEGKFGGIQAVSADVLREPLHLSQPTLVQLGQALMFLTQRGVMMIAGTKINCVSEAMNGRHFNPMTELDGVDYHVGAFANLIQRTSDTTDFKDFAANGFLTFDYAHNRVLLLRGTKDYQYVYSLNTGLWSKEIIYTNPMFVQIENVPTNTLPSTRSNPILQVKPIRAAVNNYTEMYLQDTEGWLYKTMEVMGENNAKQLYQYGYFISRPIRFGTDEYKTIVRALHRYTHYTNNSFVKMALYGSRDGVKYGRINTLRGMSYQYFIFAIYTYLKSNERYSYLSVDFETRLSNKLR